MAKSLLTTSLSARTKLLQTGVSLYNTSHGFHEEEVKKILAQFPGGSVDLQKKQNGIGILTLNNPNKMNAFSGTEVPSPERESGTESEPAIVVSGPGHGGKILESLGIPCSVCVCVCK